MSTDQKVDYVELPARDFDAVQHQTAGRGDDGWD